MAAEGGGLAIADEFAKLVATIDAHPLASLAAGLFILLVLCLRKDGVFHRALSYLEERAKLEASLENRRIEILRLRESRAQMVLPGVDPEEAGQEK